MILFRELDARHGVAATDELRDAGVTRHELRRALEAGSVTRLRRGWVALPGADPMLQRAAALGVTVTCVTRAERLGLWTFGSADPHVAAPPNGRVLATTSAHVHWGQPVAPRPRHALEDSVANTLGYVAACQPYEQALVVWESAARKELIDRDILRRLPFGPQARRIIAEMRWHSDSGLESVVIPRLRWLKLPMRQQVWIAGHRVDLLIGDRLVLQIDGGHHVDAQRRSDNEHDAVLRLMGYHVIRIGYHQVIDDWPRVQELILSAVAQGLHLAA